MTPEMKAVNAMIEAYRGCTEVFGRASKVTEETIHRINWTNALVVMDEAVSELTKAVAGLRDALSMPRPLGRPRKPLSPKEIADERAMGIPIAAIARKHGVSRSTIYRILDWAK